MLIAQGSVTELLSFSSPRRSPSPPDPRIAISPALAELATTAPALDIPPIAPVAVNEANLLPDDSEMRGEMGGKRRKAPHERAGWKEMDEQRDWKRTRKKRGSSDAIQDFVGYSGPGTGAGTLESDLIEAHGEMGLPGELPSTEGTTVALLDPQLVGQGEGEDEGAKSADGAGAKGEKAAVDS
jgi:hypothetical protein